MFFVRGILIWWFINTLLVLVSFKFSSGRHVEIQNRNHTVGITYWNDSKEFVSGHKRQEREVKFRREEDRLMVVYEFDIVAHIPRFSSCDEFRMEIVAKSKDGKVHVLHKNDLLCSTYGYHNFEFCVFKEQTSYLLRLIRKNNAISSVRLMFKTPRAHKRAPQVIFHVVGSSGPGWIDLRFKTLPTAFPQMYEFIVKYWRRQYNTMNDVDMGQEHYMAMNERPTFDWDVMWTAAPLYPCPEWRGQGMYCLVFTDFVRPNPPGTRKYVDYVLMIYTARVRSACYYGAACWFSENSTKSKPYKAVVRVWDNCDPTGKIGVPCLKLMLPLNQNPEVVGSKKQLKEIQEAEQTENATDTVSPTTDPVKTVRKLWPLFLFLLLLLLLVVIPWVFITTQERAMREVMSSWYCWTTPDGNAHFLIALPPDIPPGDLIPDELRQNPGNQERPGRRRKGRRSSSAHN